MEHCWHETGEYRMTTQLVRVDICCHCGICRYRKQRDVVIPGHGQHFLATRKEHYYQGGEQPCTPSPLPPGAYPVTYGLRPEGQPGPVPNLEEGA